MRAFTLMEMILVLGITALLLSVGTYFMVGVIGDAEEGKVKADLQALSTNLVRYKTKTRMYPTTDQGLMALVERPTIEPVPDSWKPLTKKQALMDPNGMEYQYRFPGKMNPDSFDVFSLGKDGKEGTVDDVGNW